MSLHSIGYLFREGLKSLELLIGLYLSARDGRRVALPLEY